ncbi:hypothetical protein, partial [Paenibacillus sepulcri]|uniref:hypothetical protein n=1 Tax=Paenibacillus sepulcri TaxID=359917 RepID=UPI0035EB2925
MPTTFQVRQAAEEEITRGSLPNSFAKKQRELPSSPFVKCLFKLSYQLATHAPLGAPQSNENFGAAFYTIFTAGEEGRYAMVSRTHPLV